MNVDTIHGVYKAHLEVEEELGFGIDEETTREVLQYCIRKLKYIGKDEDYLPLLYRYELPMQLSMRAINKVSEERRKIRCAQNAIAPHALQDAPMRQIL